MQKITSIGEILFDIYPDRKTIGGAPFNFIYHVIKLTGEGHFVSRVGNDENGKNIIEFLKNNDISAEYIQSDLLHPTGESIATLNEMKIPDWEIKTGTAYDFVELNNEIESLLSKKTDCLYFGTLAQRNVTTRQTIQRFFNGNTKYFCDLNIRQNFYTEDLIKQCLTACNVLKLNEDELHLVNKLLLKKNFDAYETPRALLEEYSIELLCVTRGDEGAVINKGDRTDHCRVKIKNVIDTVGAGDAYAAILCLGYLREWDIEKTNRIASEFAGEIVKINGALPADTSLYERYKELINE